MCCSGKRRRFGSDFQNLANPNFRASNFLGLILFNFVIYVSGVSKLLAESVDKIVIRFLCFVVVSDSGMKYAFLCSCCC